MPATLPCIICQTMPSKDKFTILHGVLEFRAYGNYGSTVYDPIDERTYLILNICDNCVKTLGDRGLVKECTVLPRPAKVTMKKWVHGEVEDD
jgi:hypothetical protein